MGERGEILIVLLLFSSLWLAPRATRSAAGGLAVLCKEVEREALVKFKGGLVDPSCRLSSWLGSDCCRWDGITCSNRTGRVAAIDLRNPHPVSDIDLENLYFIGNDIYDPEPSSRWTLGGKISPSLLALQHLRHLDLSSNHFGGNSIPSFIGSFTRLIYLDLSRSGFGGGVPHQLGNLSRLRYLDVSRNFGHYHGGSVLSILDVQDSARWLSRLASLQHLDMSFVRFPIETGRPLSLNAFPHIREIHLQYCLLSEFPLNLSPPLVNFTSLTTLDLRGNQAGSMVNLPNLLFTLATLEYLDLTGNQLHGVLLPSIGGMTALTHLELGDILLIGSIPDTIGNLTFLRYLSLTDNQLQGHIPSSVGNLTFLNYLGLAMNQLQGPIPTSICSAGSYISYLDAMDNQLGGTIPTCIGNMTALSYIDLSFNQLEALIPASIGGATALRFLDLSANDGLKAPAPAELGNLCNLHTLRLGNNPINTDMATLSPIFIGCLRNSLEELDLRYGQLTGRFPSWLADLTTLKSLFLRGNSLHGSLPHSFGRLLSLEHLDISYNQFKGVLSESHLDNMTRLIDLDISYNSLAITAKDGWIPPFQLEDIQMEFCPLGPQIPAWLQTQKKASSLCLSNAGIEGDIPRWFLNFSRNLELLELKGNKISGQVPQFHYPLLQYLNLANNSYSGHIPSSIHHDMPKLWSLDLSLNKMNVSIPSAFCTMKHLQTLYLSKNNFGGIVPNCWRDSLYLIILDFSDNKLSGRIPNSLSMLTSLQSLHLGNNNLHGKLPPTLKSCKGLITLDLGSNRLNGNIPYWIAESLSDLKILSLRDNLFTGIIPDLSQLRSLQILDLSENNLSGTLSPSLGSFLAMKATTNRQSGPRGYHEYLFNATANGTESIFDDEMELFMKGIKREYTNNLPLVTLIDLSNNCLFGTIPHELGALNGLQSLDLSGNRLTGWIPLEFGELHQLEYLDLSENNLTGVIPSSLKGLTFLSILNVSYNDLSGRIPTGNQFETFVDPTVYIGNHHLCGKPLKIQCEGDNSTVVAKTEDEPQAESEAVWLYIGLTHGFVVGFCLVYGMFVFKASWRLAYFRTVDNICDMGYVMMAVKFARLKKKIKRNG